MYQNLKSFYDLIENSNCIVIAGHTSPDGDALSASFALAVAISKKFGKTPIVLLEDYPKKYNYIKGSNFLYKNENYDDLSPDLFIAVDCGSIERLGDAKSVFIRAKHTVNVDHHISNDNFAQLNFVDTNSSSTSQIIFELLKDLDVFDYDIATTIYTGIVFDTNGFKHKSTSERTHQIAGELLKYNIDTPMIHTNILNYNTLPKAKVFAKAIDNIVIYKNFCYSSLTSHNITQECLAEHSDIEGLSSYLLDIEGISISALFYEKLDGTIKVSLRSKEIDVNKIASVFGGGGHKLASGASLNCSLDEAINLVFDEVKKNI